MVATDVMVVLYDDQNDFLDFESDASSFDSLLWGRTGRLTHLPSHRNAKAGATMNKRHYYQLSNLTNTIQYQNARPKEEKRGRG